MAGRMGKEENMLKHAVAEILLAMMFRSNKVRSTLAKRVFLQRMAFDLGDYLAIWAPQTAAVA